MTVTVANRQRLHKVDTRRLKHIATESARLARLALRQLGIVLVNDRTVTALNRQFHHSAAPTDVLSFDYRDGTAELIISVERALAHARRYRTSPARELALYIVHGILHLAGHDDRNRSARTRMRAAERRILRALPDSHTQPRHTRRAGGSRARSGKTARA
jgi:probable rRNA maturation factor